MKDATYVFNDKELITQHDYWPGAWKIPDGAFVFRIKDEFDHRSWHLVKDRQLFNLQQEDVPGEIQLLLLLLL